MPNSQQTIYEIIGGEETVRELVDVFYAKVEADPVLRPIFPDDLEPGKRWQYLFLMQRWGGPTQYAAERGHPRLRMRHMPFPIDSEARDHWVQHMLDAVDEVGIPEPARSEMRQFFDQGATFMINRYAPQDASDDSDEQGDSKA